MCERALPNIFKYVSKKGVICRFGIPAFGRYRAEVVVCEGFFASKTAGIGIFGFSK